MMTAVLTYQEYKIVSQYQNQKLNQHTFCATVMKMELNSICFIALAQISPANSTSILRNCHQQCSITTFVNAMFPYVRMSLRSERDQEVHISCPIVFIMMTATQRLSLIHI